MITGLILLGLGAALGFMSGAVWYAHRLQTNLQLPADRRVSDSLVGWQQDLIRYRSALRYYAGRENGDLARVALDQAAGARDLQRLLASRGVPYGHKQNR